MEKITSSEYAKLLKAARQRARRLKAKGYDAPEFTGTREAAKGDLRKEYRKLERWMSKEENTVKGRRAQEERKAEAKRQREAEREAKRRRSRSGSEGDGTGGAETRPPIETADERRKRLHREAQKRYYEKQKRQKQELEDFVKNAPYQYGNLLSGLTKYGVKIKTPEELEAWMKYIQERKADGNPFFYEFDRWLDEAAEAAHKSLNKLTADDIYSMIENFQAWKAEQASMEEQLHRERQPDEYKGDEFRNLWREFFGSK